MSAPKPNRLSDIFWGGQVRQAYRSQVREIATGAARSVQRSFVGNMVRSTECVTFSFLDGGLSETLGGRGPGSGMRWFGTLATAYILYELGESPQDLLATSDIPCRDELKERVRLEAEAARRDRTPGGR
jgi:hypothetical protein